MTDEETQRRPGQSDLDRVAVEYMEQVYRLNHSIEGIAFVANKPGLGVRLASDNDNALYTGMQLASASHRAALDPGSFAKSASVVSALKGITALLTVSGTPGVLARWAFPLDGDLSPWDTIGYNFVRSQASKGNTWGDRIKAGQLYEISHPHTGNWAFQTKTTRDQLSGVLFGLTAVSLLVPDLKPWIARLVSDLHARLLSTNWSLEDSQGRRGTTAHRADRPQRLIVRALDYMLNGGTKPSESWFDWVWLLTAHYNRHWQNTYSYNLNLMDCWSLWMLRDHHKERRGVERWERKLWSMVKGDANPFFAAIHEAITGEELCDEAVLNWRHYCGRPYHNFFRWSRPPSDWNVPPDATTIGPQIDTRLPYWMNEYHNLNGETDS